jgi:hypothetical protein
MAFLLAKYKAPDSLKALTRYQYSLSPPADVPVFLYAKDLTPLTRFSHVLKILGPGRRLLVISIRFAGYKCMCLSLKIVCFGFRPAAIRLVTMANADLVPFDHRNLHVEVLPFISVLRCRDNTLGRCPI